MTISAPPPDLPPSLALVTSVAWRRAVVVGAGRSGLAAACVLLSLGVEVTIYDAREQAWPPASGSITETAIGWHARIRFLGGEGALEEALRSSPDLMVLSPGVPPLRPRQLAAQHCPAATIHGEMSLALALLATHVPTVLITGTNGKSTVTALTGHLLSAGGMRPFVGGNLGVPLCEALMELASQPLALRPASLVLECSSFQLETMSQVPCEVAMILNITPDHLDRYASMEDYAAAKIRVMEGLVEGGTGLLFATDAWTPRLRSAVPKHATLIEVGGSASLRLDPSSGAFQLGDDEQIERAALPLAGAHNGHNALFALAAARVLLVPLAVCRDALASFRGLPHRMEHVATLEDVMYFDDSKATNVTSALAGLRGFPRRYVLIAGGRAKGDALDELGVELRSNARALVVIGEAARDFLALAQGVLTAQQASTLPEAVKLASDLARPGDAVILSPACASYDMFRSYVHRGEVFCAAVLALPSRRPAAPSIAKL